MRKSRWVIGLALAGGVLLVLVIIFFVLLPRARELARQDVAIDAAKKYLRDTQPGQVAFGNSFEVDAVPSKFDEWSVSGTLYRQNKEGLLEELPFHCVVYLDESDAWHGRDVELGAPVVHR